MATRKRYFKGLDKNKANMVVMVDVDLGSRADRASAETYAKRFGMTDIEEIGADEYKAALREVGRP